MSELSNFISNGESVVLMGSAAATAAGRSNLDQLAADLGTDLRLNDDQVYDPDGNAEFETGNLNTSDFSLWGPYS